MHVLTPRGDPFPPQSLGQNYENASLRCLTLGRVGAGIRDELLLHTDLPSLEVLHFAAPFGVYVKDFPKPLDSRTGASIRELSLFVSEEDIYSLVAFLRSTPNLHTLEIRTMVSLDVKASILYEDELVPHLKLLRIRGPKTTSVVEVTREVEAPKRSSPLHE